MNIGSTSQRSPMVSAQERVDGVVGSLLTPGSSASNSASNLAARKPGPSEMDSSKYADVNQLKLRNELRRLERMGQDDFDDSDDDNQRHEKRAGRRKIRIEYIEDKSRRHITFSKRKAGIMKKAYELSTLTGTQVLILIASETGHAYTFATPKLQPLITKPEGKNLIQACLNAPDQPPDLNGPFNKSPHEYRDSASPAPVPAPAPTPAPAPELHTQNLNESQYRDEQQKTSMNSQESGGYAQMPTYPNPYMTGGMAYLSPAQYQQYAHHMNAGGFMHPGYWPAAAAAAAANSNLRGAPVNHSINASMNVPNMGNPSAPLQLQTQPSSKQPSRCHPPHPSSHPGGPQEPLG